MLLHFPVDCFPQPQDSNTVGYQGKSKAQTMLHILVYCMYVCLFGCVCMCVSHRHMPDSHQFLATIRPSKQPFIPSASQPCSYPFIHLSIQLSRYPCSCPFIQACVSSSSSSSCRWPQLQCIMPRTYFRSRSLCRCKEFNMCFDCIVLHVALRLTLIVAAW